jgi:hypothetical protein
MCQRDDAANPGLAVERSPYNETALDWLTLTTPVADQALVDVAVSALDRVVAANSELAELWDEAGQPRGELLLRHEG